MADNPLKYPKGSIMVFTAGEYSDFHTAGFLVTVVDCDLPTLARAYARTCDEWDARLDGFAGWLVANGHAMPVEASQIHLGTYGRWEPEFGVSAHD